MTEVFASDRLNFLNETAGFRRIDLHWCLIAGAIEGKSVRTEATRERHRHVANACPTSRKTATILESHLGNSLGLRMLGKAEDIPVLQLPLQPRRVGCARSTAG